MHVASETEIDYWVRDSLSYLFNGVHDMMCVQHICMY